MSTTKKPPSISVIMSVYNQARYLLEGVNSILNQTFKDFEFIIIDDGSKDRSWKIIQEFAQKDQRIKPFQNKQNKGLTYSLNRGLKLARGKYIARQDADEISLPKRLAYQYSYLRKNPAVFLVGAGAIVIDQSGQETARYQRKDNPARLARRLKRFNPLFHSSIMFLNQGIAYRQKFYLAQDYDLYLRLLSMDKKITVLPRLLIKHRSHPSSLTCTLKQKQKRFARKAREFYKQRLKYGQDQYSDFDPQTIL